MSDDAPNDNLPIAYGSPESFGWQRRPDLDAELGIAYEDPKGALKLFRKGGEKPEMARWKGHPFNERG